MRRLLIVDDEYHIREGLKIQIGLTGLPITIVGAVEDGQTALQTYKELKPDIVLLDINLPDFNGLEVARRIREQDDETQLLFLTGYNSIGFIREAITLETADYMLKPITKEELVSGLLRAEERIQRRKRLSDSTASRRSQELYMTQEYALLDLLQQRRPWADLYEALQAAKAPIIKAKPPYVVLCCELEKSLDQAADSNDCQQFGVDFARRALEAAQLCSEAYGAASSPECLLIVLSSVDKHTVMQTAKEVRSAIEADTPITLTIGISRMVTELRQLPEACREAMHAAEHKGWVGNGQIIPFESVQVAETYNPHLLDKELILLAEIRAGNDGAVRAIVEEWSEQFKGMSSRQIKLMATQLILYVMRVVQSRELVGSNDRLCQDPLAQISQMTNAHEMISFVTDYFVQVSRWCKEARENIVPKMFEDARNWIREHLHEDVSLNGLAEYLHMSPKYVSTRFKQVTGESFAQFLTRIRFERARELLLDPGEKVSSVAAAVGYGDTNYFSIAFKKNTGLTPSEFRKRYL